MHPRILKIMVATEPEQLRLADVPTLEALLAEILELPAQPEVEAFFGAARRRAPLVQAELARREQAQVQSLEQNRWSADMLQKIHAHDEAMRLVRDQLKNQKDSSRRAMIVSIVAAIAAVASAVAAFLVKNPTP